jgi:CRP/FNR family cyclic AMP-dependent transcriptional regulator
MNSPYGLPTDCVACHERTGNFFCALSLESQKAFDRIKHGSVVPQGAVIFVEGQQPRGIYLLCAGRAKLSATACDGKTFILRIAKPGEVLGLQATITGRPYELTVETMQPSHLNFVCQKDFLRFIEKYADACLRTAQHISRDCQDAYSVIRSIGLSHSVPARIAKFLLEAATDGFVSDGVVRARFALTHEDIAQLMGTCRETITRTLSDLRKKNIVELKNAVLIVHNKPALERIGIG